MPTQDVMPSTVQRSSRKAQQTWTRTYDSAVEQYGEGGRAARVANASLKRSFQKVGDRWMPKDGKGPSDRQAERGYRGRPTKTASGVDASASKKDLLNVARRMEIRGRTNMNKPELVAAIQAANQHETRNRRPSARRR